MTDIHGILASINEAKQALDRQPELEGRIRELEHTLAERERHNQSLELTIAELRSEASELNSKLRAAEVARDEAAFRELEAEDKADKALSVVRKVLGEAQQYVEAVEPVSAPEPVNQSAPEPDPFVESTVSQSETVEYSPAPIMVPAPEPEPTQPVGRYADQHYWERPSNVSWHDWVAEGGEKAPWMS